MAQQAQQPHIYGGQDPVDVAAYNLGEVVQCLRVPTATLRTWCLGRSYPSASGPKQAAPLVEIADKRTPALSFRNVIELHVLSAIRRKHSVKMAAVRRAITYVKRRLHIQHPLADQQMATDGKDLFIEHYGRLLNISQGGQIEMKAVVDAYLSRIERDDLGVPIKLFPFTRTRIDQAPKLVVINPWVQFGRPCIAGTGIPTSIIAERYRAGDSIQELAEDYAQTSLPIEEAIRYEFTATAA